MKERNIEVGKCGNIRNGIWKSYKRSGIVLFAFIAFAALAAWAPVAGAESGFYTSRGCSGCHGTAATTCNGCHNHGPAGLSAQTNKTTYAPGEAITVTVNGGRSSGATVRGGWVRALLYLNNVEIARSTGPSTMGGGASFPITFSKAGPNNTGATLTAPTTPGTYTYQAAWFGNSNNSGSTHGEERVTTNSFTVSAPASAPTITTAGPLPTGTVGTAYGHTLAASGGTAPYAWSVAAMALPAGLALNSSTGVLGGTPTAAGTFTFTVQVTGGGSSTKAFSLTIDATPDTAPPVLNSVDPADTQAGVAVNTVLTATFSEEVVVPEGSFTLSDGAGSVPGSVSVDGATATFTPSVILNDNTVYTVTLTTAVTDLAGNPVGTGYGSTFTTSAEAPASVLDLESSGGGGCAIVRSGGDIGGIAGAYGFLILSALGMAIRKRMRRKVE